MGPGRWSGGEGSLKGVTEHWAGALQAQRGGRRGQIGSVREGWRAQCAWALVGCEWQGCRTSPCLSSAVLLGCSPLNQLTPHLMSLRILESCKKIKEFHLFSPLVLILCVPPTKWKPVTSRPHFPLWKYYTIKYLNNGVLTRTSCRIHWPSAKWKRIAPCGKIIPNFKIVIAGH